MKINLFSAILQPCERHKQPFLYFYIIVISPTLVKLQERADKKNLQRNKLNCS